MNLDEKLRAMARDDAVPLPEDYDEMLKGLYADLARDGGAQIGEKEKKIMKKRSFRVSRLVAVVAVLALMVASMTVGALAFGREVPVEQETIDIQELGLRLLLPDTWTDNYVVEYNGDNTCQVYVKSIYNDAANTITDVDGNAIHGGMLFYLYKIDGFRTPEQAEAELAMPSRFLLATSGATYMLCYASDVQYDPSNTAQAEEYVAMYQQLGEIQVVVDGIMG